MKSSAAAVLAASVLAASALLLMTGVPAGAQPKQTPTPGQATRPTVTGQSTTSAVETPSPPPPGPRPLFKIGDLNVGIWAPVQAPYNANNNRNLAANPMWQEDMAAPSGF